MLVFVVLCVRPFSDALVAHMEGDVDVETGHAMLSYEFLLSTTTNSVPGQASRDKQEREREK